MRVLRGRIRILARSTSDQQILTRPRRNGKQRNREPMSSDPPDLPDDNDTSPEETSSPSATRDAGPAVASGARSQSEQRPGGSSVSVDQRLVDQTKQQIRNLVREIARLAQSDANVGDFYEGFLGRVVSALAAEGGAIWILSDDDRLELQYQINLKNTGLHDGEVDQARHGLLLKKVLAGGQPMMIAPHAGAPGDEDHRKRAVPRVKETAPGQHGHDQGRAGHHR